MHLEQECSIHGEGPLLEARLTRVGSGVAVIAPPHPLMGGSMDNPVVEALMRGFQSGGLSTLRFNFRGVDGSAGEPSGAIHDAVADYRRVVSWARGQGFERLTFAGYSFGAVAAIETHVGGLSCVGIAVVAPPTATLTPDTLQQVRCPCALIYGARDQIVAPERYATLWSQLAGGQVFAIPSADHFFSAHLNEIVSFARDIAAAAGA